MGLRRLAGALVRWCVGAFAGKGAFRNGTRDVTRTGWRPVSHPTRGISAAADPFRTSRYKTRNPFDPRIEGVSWPRMRAAADRTSAIVSDLVLEEEGDDEAEENEGLDEGEAENHR